MDTAPRPSGLLGRIVFQGQWLVAFVAPALLFVGRTWFGAPDGWLRGIGLLTLAPPMFLLLGALPLLLATNTVSLPTRSAPRGYSWASVVLWLALVVLIVGVSDPGSPGTSLLSIWSHGAVSDETSAAVATGAGGAAAVCWLVAAALAVGSVISARAKKPD
jgi:hypothetical protein